MVLRALNKGPVVASPCQPQEVQRIEPDTTPGEKKKDQLHKPGKLMFSYVLLISPLKEHFYECGQF